METGLAGRTAVVAGASQGIGRAVRQAFASEAMPVAFAETPSILSLERET